MYPFVMKEYDHPTGREYEFCSSIREAIQTGKPFFAIVSGATRGDVGPFPVATDEGVDYPLGEFNDLAVTSHEIRAAIECRALEWLADDADCWIATETIRFAKFVDHWTSEKVRAKNCKDVFAYTFAKLILNSSYGKFGSNPNQYKDFYLWFDGEPYPSGDWELHSDYGFMSVLEKPASIGKTSFFDVATAASITGAARSVLFRSLVRAEGAVYCDTDSIICRTLNAKTDPAKLGAWKLEATGDTILIGGKKLYALKRGPKFVKLAAKGVELTGKEIERIVRRGVEIEYKRDAPTFRLSGQTKFINRRVKCTTSPKVSLRKR